MDSIPLRSISESEERLLNKYKTVRFCLRNSP